MNRTLKIEERSNHERRTEQFAETMMGHVGGAMAMLTIYIGDRLGYYDVLARHGALRADELAERTGTATRYAREWLEQQTVAGVLGVENAGDPAEERRFYLPDGHDEVLADPDSPFYLAPMAQLAAAAVRPLDELVRAYRTGGGVAYEAYGPDMREGQARMNRVLFLGALGEEYLPSIPDVHRKLSARRGARIADVGCGAGYSSIGMALAYPNVRVDGFDLDGPSIELARSNAREAGVSDRVKFHVRDAGDPGLEGRYDLVTAFECIHDMNHPSEVLASMKRLSSDDGAVIVMDEKACDKFTPEGSGIEWLLYGFSVLHCLPVGMTAEGAAGTGTVMRCGTFERYTGEAGFERVEVLPIENEFFRFYRLYR